MSVAKKTTALQMQAPSSGGGLPFGRKQDTVVKSLGSKKLDINFESDDFFNSF